MPNSLRNTTVVITGASSGIGKAAAFAFAAQGANLVLGARRDEALFEVAEEAQRYGVHAIAVPSDVTDLEDMRQLASTAAQRFGGSTSGSTPASGWSAPSPTCLWKATAKSWRPICSAA